VNLISVWMLPPPAPAASHQASPCSYVQRRPVGYHLLTPPLAGRRGQKSLGGATRKDDQKVPLARVCFRSADPLPLLLPPWAPQDGSQAGGASASSLQAQQRNLCRSMAEVFSDPMRAEEGCSSWRASRTTTSSASSPRSCAPPRRSPQALATQVRPCPSLDSPYPQAGGLVGAYGVPC